MLQRYLILWLSLLSLLAYAWTDELSSKLGSVVKPLGSVVEPLGSVVEPLDGVDPFVAGKNSLALLVSVTMFAIGGLLPRDEIAQVARRWPVVLGGTAVQYVVMPLLALAAIKTFPLSDDLAIGVMIVGCVPGAMASNVLTLLARGNVSYSVSLTTSATLLSPLVVPLAMWLMLGEREGPEPLKVFMKLLLTVVGPVVLGHLLSRRFDRLRYLLDRFGATVANLAILWIVAVVVGINRDRLASAAGELLFILLLINIIGYLAGYSASRVMRLPPPMRKALTLEIGMQNAGVGTMLAASLFPGRPETMIAPAVYTFGCMFTGTILARIWAARSS